MRMKDRNGCITLAPTASDNNRIRIKDKKEFAAMGCNFLSLLKMRMKNRKGFRT